MPAPMEWPNEQADDGATVSGPEPEEICNANAEQRVEDLFPGAVVMFSIVGLA